MTGLRALLIDAHGTLLHLESPVPALCRILRERFGLEVGESEAAAALGAEIAYYRRHLNEGRDQASLAHLRARCAQVLFGALPPARCGALDGAAPEALTAALLDSLSFRAFDDAAPALAAARAGGLRVVVVSNWDASLPETLDRISLLGRVDGVVTSAECGLGKPDPAPFAAALSLAGVAPSEAIHVGDRVEEDVLGARAAGVEPVLLVRGGGPAGTAGVAGEAPVRRLGSLDELPGVLGVELAPQERR